MKADFETVRVLLVYHRFRIIEHIGQAVIERRARIVGLIVEQALSPWRLTRLCPSSKYAPKAMAVPMLVAPLV